MTSLFGVLAINLKPFGSLNCGPTLVVQGNEAIAKTGGNPLKEILPWA